MRKKPFSVPMAFAITALTFFISQFWSAAFMSVGADPRFVFLCWLGLVAYVAANTNWSSKRPNDRSGGPPPPAI